MTSVLRTFPSAAPRLPRALPIWSPRWMSGACRSSGPKTAHVLADIVCWYLRSQVSSRNFADPLPENRAVGRCEAKDAIPTATRRRRRIPPPFRSYSRAAMYLQGIRFGAAVQVAPVLRIPPRSSTNSWERASRRERDRPMQFHAGTGRVLVCEPAVCAKISIKTCAFGR